ncbi:MAG: alpha/beta hydrolase, partial [Halioglobus sp.]|nr:alpha/beta hydrolase [Halioglobus sp.]
MDIERINPELRRLYRWLPHLRMDRRWLLRLMRRLPAPRASQGTASVTVEDHSLAHAGVRIYRPTRQAHGAALLWIHGGGMIIGSVSQNDRECIRYANELGILVASVAYRLAPEHPFPAPLDDCFEVWEWLTSRAGELAIEPERIVVSGQSAGGGLAASLAQKVCDAGGPQPAGQALFCPMLDDRTAARRELD